jgi:hypothetical protein
MLALNDSHFTNDKMAKQIEDNGEVTRICLENVAEFFSGQFDVTHAGAVD